MHTDRQLQLNIKISNHTQNVGDKLHDIKLHGDKYKKLRDCTRDMKNLVKVNTFYQAVWNCICIFSM